MPSPVVAVVAMPWLGTVASKAHYISPGSGLSLSPRARHSLARQVQGYGVITKHFVIDRGLNRLLGADWQAYKERVAQRKAQRHLPDQAPHLA